MKLITTIAWATASIVAFERKYFFKVICGHVRNSETVQDGHEYNGSLTENST